jgi:hypothetical protein
LNGSVLSFSFDFVTDFLSSNASSFNPRKQQETRDKRQERRERRKNNRRIANTRPVVSGRNQADIAAITFTIQRMIPTTNGLSGEITIKGESIAPIFDQETQDA